MIILSFKPGHDGHIACLENSKLIFSYEAEKDSGPRYGDIDTSLVIDALSKVSKMPNALALSGWAAGASPFGRPIGGGYLGLEEPSLKRLQLLGQEIDFLSSSHERSHLMCAYGMSPFPQGEFCYILVWEGHIGSFYTVDENVRFTHLCSVMSDPGTRYAFAYGVADPTFSLKKGQVRLGDAGKLMALAAYGSSSEINGEARCFVDVILASKSAISSLDKKFFHSSPYFNVGVESKKFKNLAYFLSKEILQRFIDSVRPFINKPAPLLISGGCGLNCGWNRGWEMCGLFSEVFIPPCPNDVGSAIGTAVDTQYKLTGSAKINWTVYSGQPFIDDAQYINGFNVQELILENVADFLNDGNIIGWAQGNSEIGPRALGNRSILAAPFFRNTLERLNRIKKRENFRPIAPICLEEDMHLHFDLSHPSPYMLFFSHVHDDLLKAVTHVDGSSRPQTVNKKQNSVIYQLLKKFKIVSGYGVLCNTSLNFNGCGFINRTSDLARYSIENNLDGFVVNDKFYIKEKI